MDVLMYTITAFGMLIMVIGLIMAVVSIAAWMFISRNRRNKRHDRTLRHARDSYAPPDSQLWQNLSQMNLTLSPQDQALAEESEARDKATRRVLEAAPSPFVPTPATRPTSAQSIEAAEIVSGAELAGDSARLNHPPAPMRRNSGRFEAFDLKPEQRRIIMEIQEMLGLPREGIVLSAGQIEAVMACNRMIAHTEPNEPTTSPILLNPEERLFHSGTADLMEMPSGGGIRVHFPLEFDLAAFKGLNTPSPLARRLSSGSIVITSKRLSYTEANRQVEMPFDTITGIDLFADMIRIHGVGSSKALSLKVDNPPLVALSMTLAFSQTQG